LSGLTLLVLSRAHPAWLGAMALIAGASLPPVSACVRALYPRMVSEPALLQTAYSVDSAAVELVFTCGPALVAACVAAGHPEAAVILAALFAAFGTAVFVRVPAVMRWDASKVTRKRSWLGALRQPKLMTVFGATALYSIAFGLFEVGVTAMACGMLLLVPIDGLLLYAAVATLAGIPMSTVVATQSQLVSRLASRERLAESFTWAATVLLAGVSAGTAIGGAMAEFLPAYWLIVAAAGSTALGALWSALALR
jgi:hypothetical protein